MHHSPQRTEIRFWSPIRRENLDNALLWIFLSSPGARVPVSVRPIGVRRIRRRHHYHVGFGFVILVLVDALLCWPLFALGMGSVTFQRAVVSHYTISHSG